MPDLRVLMVAAECAPFAKAGGLADVLGALPVALEKLGVSVTIAIPRYGVIDPQKFGFEFFPSPGGGRVSLGFQSVSYDIHRGQLPGSSVEVFLIGNDLFFDRPGIYVDSTTGRDYPDQADRGSSSSAQRWNSSKQDRPRRTSSTVTIIRPDLFLPISFGLIAGTRVLELPVRCLRFTTSGTRVCFRVMFYFGLVSATASFTP